VRRRDFIALLGGADISSNCRPMDRSCRYVRFAPIADNLPRSSKTTRSAITGCKQVQQGNPYSITSSARTRNVSGMASPIALAALRLITKSNFVGCSMGSSAGLAPLNILSTYIAARR
jgi:hypothetical protein